MTYYWLNLLKKTLKHEENPEGNKSERFVLRERGYYKSWIINNILIFFVSLAVFICLTKVHYVGPLFFLAGFCGMCISLLHGFRSIMIYKNYDELEMECKKVE